MRTLCAVILSLVAPLASAQQLPSGFLPVPIFRQATDYSCGAASLLAILYYWRVDQDTMETELYRPLGVSRRDGSEPSGILRTARAYGLQAQYFRDGEYSFDRLRGAVARGDTVIVSYQAWLMNPGVNADWAHAWDDGHYSVVVAIDDNFIYLMDPSAGIGYGYIPINEFLTRWHDVEKNRRGQWRRHQRMAIEISGSSPTLTIPAPLIRVL